MSSKPGISVELPEIKAGFPSPAQDYVENGIDLNRELVKNPSSTFFGRARGSSMEGAGIFDGDLLIIDKSLEPYEGAVAVCSLTGSLPSRGSILRGRGFRLWLYGCCRRMIRSPQ